jgi:phosphatidylglycerophosphate synthase
MHPTGVYAPQSFRFLSVMIHTMVFLVFAPLLFLILRLTVRWRWRTVLLVAIVLSVLADFILDGLVARRP